MNIADIKKLESGATVPSVTGLVSEVREQRNVNGRRGLTSVQEIKLAQGNDWIQVVMWGRDDLTQLKGQEIKIANDRGLQVKEESFESKKTGKMVTLTKLQAGEHATITSPGWGTPEPQPAQQQARPPQQTQLRPIPDESGVKEKLNRLANLYLDCIVAADYVTATRETMGKWSMTDGHYQACVASLFIQATREGLHEKVATGKFNTPKPAPVPVPVPVAPPPPPPAPRPTPAVQQNDPGYAFLPGGDIDEDVPF